MIKKFTNFSEDLIVESILNESIIYFSPKMREQLVRVDSEISKRLLDLEGKDIPKFDATFFDVDEESNVTFITMQNAMKLIKAKYPHASDANMDVSGDKRIADILYQNDIVGKKYGSGQDTGIYFQSRNTIKVGKLVNSIFKGTLKPTEVEKFVNDFKASGLSNIQKIELVSGEDIKLWYEKSYGKSGSLGSSCMSGKYGSFFNIYSENPDTCQLLIMTVGGELVARGLVWKLNSIKSIGEGKSISQDNRPEYFLDRVYSVEDYQIQRLRKWASNKGWAIRKRNGSGLGDSIIWKGNDYNVEMSVKVKKSNYGKTFPYMDTFCRYDQRRGLLWNDIDWIKGGHILSSTSGGYTKSAPLPLVYLNKFKDFFKN